MKPLLLLMSCILCGCVSPKWQASRVGASDARKESESGILALEVYGFGAGLPTPYNNHLEKNGVEIRAVAGCLVDEEIIGHAKGFNRVMRREIQKKLGADIFRKAEQSQQNGSE